MRSLISVAKGLAAVCAFGLMAASAAAPASAYPPYDLRVINETSSNMIGFYATNSYAGNWGEDLLGDDVLHPGYWMKFNLSDGTGACVFDLRAVFRDGRTAERYRLNVCTTSSWTVY